jgi:hypothetical protein
LKPNQIDVGKLLDFAILFGSNGGVVDVCLISRRKHLRAKTAFSLLQPDVGLTKKQRVHGDVPTYRAAKHSEIFDLVIRISH